NANSVICSAAIWMLPAAFRRAMSVLSSVHGFSRRIRAPQLGILPARSNMSLWASGTPASGPTGWPAAMAASVSLAAARASSASVETTALNASCTAFSRSSAELTTSVLEIFLERMASARSTAEMVLRSMALVPLALEHTNDIGGIGVERQRVADLHRRFRQSLDERQDDVQPLLRH